MPDGWQTNRYNYKVVRLWQDDPEVYLTAGVELVPLAPLAAVSVPDLPALVQRMGDRINREPPPLAAKLWTATWLLMGLRYSEEQAMRLLEGVQIMHQSTTYERILREGSVAEARRFLVRLGTQQYGEPDPATAAALEAIQDVDRLESLGERILRPDLTSWEELLKGS
ncbi:MAG: hypothetical protein ACHRXM_34680 [Isosphaerales bacterium]